MQAEAKKAAQDAEEASEGAAGEAAKAGEAKTAAASFAEEAEKWFKQEDVPANAEIAMPPEGDAEARPASGVPGDAAADAAPSLPAPLAGSLLDEWHELESTYIDGLAAAFRVLRKLRNVSVEHFMQLQNHFVAYLKRPDSKAMTLANFVRNFNAIEPDLRSLKATQVSKITG